MLQQLRGVIALLCLLALPLYARAVPVVVDFESFLDGDSLNNQIAGLTVANATVLSAGISLNEFEFPPRSGTNAVFDDGGALTIDFASPVSSVGGYFTYATTLTIEGFDELFNSIGIVSSAFLANLAMSGDLGSVPNEFIGLDFAAGISRIVVSGDPGGASFVLDDLTYTVAEPSTPVPEPSTLPLLLTVAAILVLTRSVARGRPRSSELN